MIGLHIYPSECVYYESSHSTYAVKCRDYSFTLAYHSNPLVQHTYENDQYAVLIDGWIFNAESYANQCEFVLNEFKKHADGFVEHINGQYNTAIINKSTGNFIVANDIFGLRTHFSLHEPSRFMMSSDIQFIRKYISGNSYNTQAIQNRLALPRFQQRDTFYSGISFAGGCMLYSSDSHNIERYSIDKIKSRYSAKEQSASEIISTIRETVNKVHRGGKILLELSGGIDSRFMLENILSTSCEVQTLNWGTQVSDECTIARSVANSLNVPFMGVDLNALDYTKNRQSHSRKYGGLDIFVQSAAEKALEEAKGQFDSDYVIETGLALDFYLGGSYDGQKNWLNPMPYADPKPTKGIIIKDKNEYHDYVEQNRIFSTIALRQSLHREYFDDRYSMYDYNIYFLMKSFVERGVSSYSFYMTLLEASLTDSRLVQYHDTMFDLTLPQKYWDVAKKVQNQKEIFSEELFRDSGVINFHNRYYSDFNMWFRADQSWINLINIFRSKEHREIYNFIPHAVILELISNHQSGRSSLYGDLINIITIDTMLTLDA